MNWQKLPLTLHLIPDTSNIEEKELYEYLCGCADLISDSAELDGQDYVDFLKDIILTFNNVLPPDLAKTIPENVF